MSTQIEKEKHSRRLHLDEVYIAKQVKIAKSHGIPVKAGEEHRLHKVSGTTCGDSNCVMCGNPRKFWGEPTMQEKKFIQREKWNDDTESNL
jgi:hypothetical protein